MAKLNALRFALAAAAGTACLFINDNTSSTQRSSLISQADARIGRPGTPLSVAGVARRHYRRAAVGAAVVGAGLAANAYYGGYGTGSTYGGYPGGYYGGYANNGVYANRSYVTGRPTLIPRRYGW